MKRKTRNCWKKLNTTSLAMFFFLQLRREEINIQMSVLLVCVKNEKKEWMHLIVNVIKEKFRRVIKCTSLTTCFFEMDTFNVSGHLLLAFCFFLYNLFKNYSSEVKGIIGNLCIFWWYGKSFSQFIKLCIKSN